MRAAPGGDRRGDAAAGAPDYSVEELGWLVRTEQVVYLADLVQRRTSLALEGRLTRAVLAELADVAASVLGWMDAERAQQVDRLAALLRDRHGVADLVDAR
ncbi:hypothetical protein GCM10025869_14970 [Homoserinibacter gongjuensis]|uniref:Alpha-glycerophosphate oxidase C-terminal domain-containing protein n=1 Tax=Homoserinibacter gongjuensis TaxID=1162968 RepID=A0ABQ6JS54_9MICO|nr:glycerol-3-phosphate dehydrogenase C-terminal domain-containing protein [Homoserinibacter gongjuensis]GMA90968.1 hypothetical protein GCM10025869_14970 [Homoserinibacter gongjuensis]